jgi:hypothetical protein
MPDALTPLILAQNLDAVVNIEDDDGDEDQKRS